MHTLCIHSAARVCFVLIITMVISVYAGRSSGPPVGHRCIVRHWRRHQARADRGVKVFGVNDVKKRQHAEKHVTFNSEHAQRGCLFYLFLALFWSCLAWAGCRPVFALVFTTCIFKPVLIIYVAERGKPQTVSTVRFWLAARIQGRERKFRVKRESFTHLWVVVFWPSWLNSFLCSCTISVYKMWV